MDKRFKEEYFVCFECGVPIDEFNLTGLCKKCFIRERRKDDNKYNEYIKAYQKTPEYKARRKLTRKKWRNPEYEKTYRKKNKDKINTRRREKRKLEKETNGK